MSSLSCGRDNISMLFFVKNYVAYRIPSKLGNAPMCPLAVC